VSAAPPLPAVPLWREGHGWLELLRLFRSVGRTAAAAGRGAALPGLSRQSGTAGSGRGAKGGWCVCQRGSALPLWRSAKGWRSSAALAPLPAARPSGTAYRIGRVSPILGAEGGSHLLRCSCSSP